MRTELTDKILSWVKAQFQMDAESTEAEIHEKLTTASDDLKTEMVVNVAGQIAGFALDEIKKGTEQFAEQLRVESSEIIEQLNAKIEILQTRIEENNSVEFDAKLQNEIEKVRLEFAEQLIEIKSAKGLPIDGDGDVIRDSRKDKAVDVPKTSVWKVRV